MQLESKDNEISKLKKELSQLESAGSVSNAVC
jgi:hypothetical protein